MIISPNLMIEQKWKRYQVIRVFKTLKWPQMFWLLRKMNMLDKCGVQAVKNTFVDDSK